LTSDPEHREVNSKTVKGYAKSGHAQKRVQDPNQDIFLCEGYTRQLQKLTIFAPSNQKTNNLCTKLRLFTMKISCSIATMLALTTPVFAALRASVSTTTAKTQIVIQGMMLCPVAL
jgi:hypothetical protein